MARVRALFPSVLVVGALGLAVACGSTADGSGFRDRLPDGSTGGGDQDGSSGDGGGTFVEDPLETVTITPADPVIEVVNGTIPAAVTFKATGTTKKGSVSTLDGKWEFDRVDVAAMAELTGAMTATGFLGGKGTVKFVGGGKTATTSATVRLKYTSDPQLVDANIKAKLGAATDADGSLGLLYPYDRTVFPRGLLGPTVQWNAAAATDVYYLKAQSPTFSFEHWGTVPSVAGGKFRFNLPTAPADVWKKLTDSNVGDVSVSIQRYDGTKAYLAKTQTWTIAPANLAGTIYFWEVNNGNVVRIKPGASSPESFLQKPSGVTCVACHSVSKDGQRMVASFNGGRSPWGTFDTATGASLYATNANSGFQAISPSGTHILSGHWRDDNFTSTGGLDLSAYNSTTVLASLNPGGGAPSHPAWASDATKVAFSVRTDGNGLDFTQSTLWVTDVNLATPGFANTKKIVSNTAQRPCVTFPTFAPDSKWIAFERSTQARSRGAQSEIWLTNLDGSVQIQLDKANGVGSIPQAQTATNYEPTFNPVQVGGYFWLVIVSERQYGNTLEDTNVSTRRKQLWVTAIDASPQAGKDPSHPAFWLPGQELNNQNMRAEWALSPCKKQGETCSAGYDCCDGFCRQGDAGTPVCSPKPSGCSQIGETCKVSSDCCKPGAQCVAGFCSDVPN